MLVLILENSTSRFSCRTAGRAAVGQSLRFLLSRRKSAGTHSPVASLSHPQRRPPACSQGALIRYSLRWRIFPIRWTTEIVEWDPPHGFVDVQLKGPYQLWRHQHRLERKATAHAFWMKSSTACPSGFSAT